MELSGGEFQSKIIDYTTRRFRILQFACSNSSFPPSYMIKLSGKEVSTLEAGIRYLKGLTPRIPNPRSLHSLLLRLHETKFVKPTPVKEYSSNINVSFFVIFKDREAIKCYRRAADCNDREAIALHQLAKMHKELGRFEEAAFYYKQDLERMEDEEREGRNTVEALLFLGQHCKDQKRFEEAIMYCNRLLDYTGPVSCITFLFRNNSC